MCVCVYVLIVMCSFCVSNQDSIQFNLSNREHIVIVVIFVCLQQSKNRNVCFELTANVAVALGAVDSVESFECSRISFHTGPSFDPSNFQFRTVRAQNPPLAQLANV